jgi:hypothetical protein
LQFLSRSLPRMVKIEILCAIALIPSGARVLAADNYLDYLPVEARITRYCELAEGTLQRAAMASDPQTRREFLNTSASWHALASELAKKAAKPVRDEPSPKRTNAPLRDPDAG